MSCAASPSTERTYGVVRVEGKVEGRVLRLLRARSFCRLPARSDGKKIRTWDTIRTERLNEMWATDQIKAVTLTTAKSPWRRHSHAPREFQQPWVRTQVVVEGAHAEVN